MILLVARVGVAFSVQKNKDMTLYYVTFRRALYLSQESHKNQMSVKAKYGAEGDAPRTFLDFPRLTFIVLHYISFRLFRCLLALTFLLFFFTVSRMRFSFAKHLSLFYFI